MASKLASGGGIVLALSVAGCGPPVTGAILVKELSPSPVSLARSELTVMLRDLGGTYEDPTGRFDSLLAERIVSAQMFQRVERGGSPSPSVDLVLRGRVNAMRFEREIHPAYVPLSLLTLTMYIWFGGPIGRDTEHYDIVLTAAKPDGEHVFDVKVVATYEHEIDLYSDEFGRTCPGPNAGIVVAELLAKLGAAVLDVRRERPG